MKKSYLLMAAAATMFAACTQADFVNEAPESAPQAIGFDTYSNKVVRATDLEKAHKTFGVWAYMDATPIMTNYKVEHQTDDKWVYEGIKVGEGEAQPLRYWNKNATYKFYAYSPFSEAATFSEGKISIPSGAYAGTENIQTSFSTTATDAVFTTNTDWMIATPQEAVSGKTGGTVTEEFNHIMSKLDVVVTTSGNEKVKVSAIKIKGLPTTGSYDGAAWTATAVNSDGVAGVVNAETEVVNGTSYYTIQSLLIPTTTASLTLDITYSIDGIQYNYTNIAVDALTKFVAGTRYTLTATIGLSPIVFDAVYNDWTVGSSPSVSIQ